MNRQFTFRLRQVYAGLLACLAFFIVLAAATQVKAQQINLGCNATTSLTATSPSSASLTAVDSGFDNPGNLIDANTSNSADKGFFSVIGTFYVEVRDNSIGASYPGGSFAGFVLDDNQIASLLSSVTISTYLGNQLQDSYSNSDLVSSTLIGGGGKGLLGFVTSKTKPFNRIRFTVNALVSLGPISIYYAAVRRFCENTTPLACNTPTNLDQNVYPVAIDANNTGITGLCVGCSVDTPENVIDNSSTTAATIASLVSVGAQASIAVKNQLQTYPINTFAGFDVETKSLLAANLLGSVTVSLYSSGSLVQSATGSNLILGATSSVLNNTNTRQIIGITSTVPVFDEVKITFTKTGADLGTTSVYNTIIQRACEGAVLCNTTNFIQNPAFPAVINSARTGVTGGVCAACGVGNTSALISPSTTDFATLNSTVGVATQTSVSVQTTVGSYPAGSYAGFVIKKNNFIVATSLLSSIVVSTYNNGVLQESSTTSNLLDLSLLGTIAGVPNNTVFNLGFPTTKAFDEIQISVGALVTGLDQFINVYSAFVDTRTAFGGTVACFNLNPDFAVTTKNVPVAGNVKTNDIVGAGTTYGTPVTTAGNPNTTLPVMNTDGSFTFTSSLPGSYTFTVPVCPSSLTVCPTSKLYITVLDPTVTTNKPVVNPDFASTIGSATNPAPVTINVKANDGPGNPGGVLGTPTISVQPTTGTASVNGSGNVVYTPAAGSYGIFTFTYQVCETPGGLCSTALVTVTVKDPSATSTVSIDDDYISTNQNTAVSGNVLTNDLGTGLSVSNAGTITSPGKGTLVLGSNGAYTFTPTTGVTGPVDFTYTSCNNSTTAVCGTATLHVLVLPSSTVLNPDFAVTTKNVPVAGNVKTNDMVPTGTTYGTPVASGGNPAGGTITSNPDGTFSFTATTAGSFTYTVPVCPAGQSVACPTSPLIITVLDPTVTTNKPVADPDYASVLGSPTTPSTVTVNVKANDGPGNPGGVLGTPTIVVNPAHGTASVNGSGNVVYTPTAGYYGPDVLTYQVCETPGGLCSTATVTLTVKAPGSSTATVVDDYVSTAINTPVSGNVLTNDQGTGLNVSNAGTITSPGKGTLVLGANGAYTFTPTANVSGPVDFTYTACDNSATPVCGTATLHILVAPLVPVLNPDFAVTTKNVPVSGNVNTNDVVPTGTTYGTPVAAGGNPAGGTITSNPDGTFSFTATTAGSFTYTVPVCPAGQSVACPTSPLIITVLDPTVTTNKPVADPDYASTTVGVPVTVNVKANDGPGNPGGVLGTPTVVISPAHGTASVNGSGNVVYTPTAGYVGTDVLTYQVCETPGGLCSTALVTLTVKAPGSSTATVVDDYVSTAINTPVSGNVLTNDQGTGLNVSNAGTITSPGKGTLVLGANGAYTFTPTANVSGPVDFTYTACDNSATPICGTATLHILVTPLAPVLNPDFAVTTKNVPVAGNVNTNDVVPTGTTYGTPVASGGNPAGGTITSNPDGTFSFTATTAGSFTYTVPVCPAGQSVACPTSPLIITVLDPTVTTNKPVADPDYASVLGSPTTPSTVTVNVKANDGPGNPGGVLGTPTIVVNPAHGTASINGSGNVVYTPTAGYYGPDVLTYQVCETPGGLCSTATVTLTVKTPGSSTVTIVDDYTKTAINTAVTGNVLTNDQGTGLSVSNTATITSPGKGTLVLGANGAYTFTPTANVSGPVDFTYTACDNSATPICGTATLHILVTPLAPVLNPDFAVTNINVPVAGNVNTNDVVPVGTTYGTPVAAGGNPAGGTITSNPDGTFSFTATTAGSFTYTVPVCPAGQSVACPTSPLIITVLDPTVTTNKPVADPDYASTTVGVPVTVNVKANDGAGNPGGTLGTPTVVGTPAHGTASINGSGNLVYTPTAGYVGDDVVTYQVCETPGGLCSTAQVTVHVTPAGSSTVAIVDDFVKTKTNTPITGNVLTNDLGTSLSVSNAGTITSPGKGTLVLGSNGAYTFTPTTGVTGPVDFTYTACDNSATPVCAKATLHVLVAPTSDLGPIIYALPATQYGTTNFTVVVDVFEVNNVVSSGPITVYLTKDPLVKLSFNQTAGFVGGRLVNNSIWTLDNTDTDFYIFTTSQVIPAGGKRSFGMTGVLTPGNTKGTLTITSVVIPGSGAEVRIDNNSDADKIDYFNK